MCNFPDWNSHMKFSCSCYQGYKLSRDKFRCVRDRNLEQLKFDKCSNLGSSSIKFNNKCYAKFEENMTFDRAVKKCQSVGGKMAKIYSRRLLWTLERESFFQPFWIA